jgi:hypothetical protein
MMRRCALFGPTGVIARRSAAFIKARTAGRSRVAADSSRMLRTRVPWPRSSRPGSGRPAPRRKHKLTPFACAASEKIAADGFSVGPYPMTKKL